MHPGCFDMCWFFILSDDDIDKPPPSLLFLLLQLPHPSPPLQEALLSAVAAQVQHLIRQQYLQNAFNNAVFNLCLSSQYIRCLQDVFNI